MPTNNYLNGLWFGRGATLASMFRRPLIVAGLVSVVLTVVVQFAQVYDLRMDSYTRRLRVSAQLSAEQVAQFVESYQSALSLVSGHGVDGPDWPGRMIHLKQQFPAFETLLIADQHGRVSFAHPEVSGGGEEAMLGRDVSDRAYFKVPMATRDRFIANVLQARSPGSTPVIALSAPLFDEKGVLDGVVEGSMATTELARVHGSPLKDRGILFLVLDSDERVAYSSKALTPTPLEKLRHPLPEAGERAPIVDGLLANGASAYVAKATTPFGWTVAVVQPASIVEVEIRRDLLAMLGPATLAVVAIVWVASLLAKGLSAPIRDLSQRMKDHHLGVDVAPIKVGEGPCELRELEQAFNVLVARMNHAYEEAQQAASELSRTVKERDETIAARTAELRRANAELRYASLTDALTGCRNYRGLAEDTARVSRQCKDEDAPLGVITCDIDLFKQFNDRYGHPAGDVCLQRVASALRGALFSAGDVLARAGGEEFVALLPRLPAKATQVVAERMRMAVVALGIPHSDSSFGVVTVSVGWSVHLASADSEVEQVIAAADAALYLAKDRGRNQVVGG